MTEKNLRNYSKLMAQEYDIHWNQIELPSRKECLDVIMACHGRVVFVKFQHPDDSDRLSVIQRREIMDMRAHGAHVAVINNYENIDLVIDYLRRKGPLPIFKEI